MSEIDRTPAMHDLGGNPRYRCEPVEQDQEPLDDFSRRVDALRQVLAQKGYMRVDELRRGIESLPQDEYFSSTYYERWLASVTKLMLEKGVVTAEDLR